jgi:hypothetical protein
LSSPWLWQGLEAWPTDDDTGDFTIWVEVSMLRRAETKDPPRWLTDLEEEEEEPSWRKKKKLWRRFDTTTRSGHFRP